MPEYLAPGVFVEEIERGPKPIQGVATSTTAFLGQTQRGPVKPTLITNDGEYLRIFGDIFGTDSYMPYAVRSFFDNGGRRCYITRIVGADAEKATAQLGEFTATAVGAGTAYNRVWVRLDEGTTKDGQDPPKPIGFRLRVYYWEEDADGVPFDPGDDSTVEPFPVEDFDDLSVDPRSQAYFEKRVNNGNSSFVELSAPEGVALPGVQSSALADGTDGADVNNATFAGTHEDPSQRTGLAALDLDEFREIAIVHAPGVDDETARRVITHCENNRFRFAVVDSQANVGRYESLQPRTDLRDSQYAAMYYPWMYISDPRSGAKKKIPPGGAVCGIYARTDNTRGVFKAPANETVRDAVELEYDVNQRAQETLNPRGINAIRRFPGRGIRVWGARTLASDPLWKYVSVRRLFIFVEHSIYDATQWVVFEPNDQRLWARVRQTVTLFLRTQWREGALFGATEEEAFSVAVGVPETMTRDDELNGRLIIEIGIAPVRPAEFVIFRVFQKTQEAQS